MKIAFLRASRVYDDSRATKEIRALVEDGHDLVVFAWDRDGNAENKCISVFSSIIEHIEFHFYKNMVDGHIGKQFWKMAGWLLWLKNNVKKNGPYDALHSCDLDTALSIRKYCHKTKTPFVYDIFDYYVDSHDLGVLSFILEKKEVKIINSADYTIICTEERIEQINKSNPKKVVVIHNTPDVLNLPHCEIENDYVYCGSFTSHRLIEEFIHNYHKHNHLRVTFAGSGAYNSDVKQLSDNEANFNYLGSIPYDKVLEVESSSKVLAAIYDPSIRNHRLCAPNKFYESLALGKPIVVCKGTGIDQIVEENKNGIIINHNIVEFYDAIEKLVSNSELCQEMGKISRELYEKKYTWTLMKNRLVSIYREINTLRFNI